MKVDNKQVYLAAIDPAEWSLKSYSFLIDTRSSAKWAIVRSIIATPDGLSQLNAGNIADESLEVATDIVLEAVAQGVTPTQNTIDKLAGAVVKHAKVATTDAPTVSATVADSFQSAGASVTDDSFVPAVMSTPGKPSGRFFPKPRPGAVSFGRHRPKGELIGYVGRSLTKKRRSISFSPATVTVNAAPVFGFAEPDGVGDNLLSSESYTLRFAASDPDSESTIRLYYRDSNEGCNADGIGAWTLAQIDLIETATQYTWSPPEQHAQFYFCAVVADQVNTDRYVISRPITVSDLTPPSVIGVTASESDGTYGVGETIAIFVTFSEAVTVTGTPTLLLETGATDQSASYVSGSGSNSLVFRYTVVAGDTTSDLDYQSTAALTLNGGAIVDGNSNNAFLTLAPPVWADPSVRPRLL